MESIKNETNSPFFFTLSHLNRLSPNPKKESPETSRTFFGSPEVSSQLQPQNHSQQHLINTPVIKGPMTAAKKLFDSDQQRPLFSGMRTEEGEDGGPRDNESTPGPCKKKLDFGKTTSDDVFMSSERDFEDDLEEMKDSSYEETSRKKSAMYAGRQ